MNNKLLKEADDRFKRLSLEEFKRHTLQEQLDILFQMQMVLIKIAYIHQHHASDPMAPDAIDDLLYDAECSIL